MYDSNMIPGCQGKYLYKKEGLQLEFFAAPHGRIPIGRKQNNRTIAINKKGSNRYPDEKRLEPANSISIGNEIVYYFEYN